jgi:hypothetical protein
VVDYECIVVLYKQHEITLALCQDRDIVARSGKGQDRQLMSTSALASSLSASLTSSLTSSLQHGQGTDWGYVTDNFGACNASTPQGIKEAVG